VPSGLDAQTGIVRSPAIRAAATATIALPKKGLLDDDHIDVVGDVYALDISVPPTVYEAFGFERVSLFDDVDVVRLR
jgi:NAD(P)H-hydrate epimerase